MQFEFTESDLVKSEAPSVLADGNYNLRLLSVDQQENAKGGFRLNCCFEVTSGPRKGKRLWDNIIISHPSEKAQEIGRKNVLSLYRGANGSDSPPESTDDLLTIPDFSARVVRKEEEWNGEKRKVNRIIYNSVSKASEELDGSDTPW